MATNPNQNTQSSFGGLLNLGKSFWDSLRGKEVTDTAGGQYNRLGTQLGSLARSGIQNMQDAAYNDAKKPPAPSPLDPNNNSAGGRTVISTTPDTQRRPTREEAIDWMKTTGDKQTGVKPKPGDPSADPRTGPKAIDPVVPAQDFSTRNSATTPVPPTTSPTDTTTQPVALPKSLGDIGAKGFYDWIASGVSEQDARRYAEQYGYSPAQLANMYNQGGNFQSGQNGFIDANTAATMLGVDPSKNNSALGNYWQNIDPQTGRPTVNYGPTDPQNFSNWDGSAYQPSGQDQSFSRTTQLPTAPQDFAIPTITGTEDTMATIPYAETVGGRVAALMRSDNPLIAKARADALQQMNARGLINSTMATQAAETAALEMAYQIASADNANYAQLLGQSQQGLISSKLSSQDAGQGLRKQAEQFLQQAELYRVEGDINMALQMEAEAATLERQAQAAEQAQALSAQEFGQKSQLSEQEAGQASDLSKQNAEQDYSRAARLATQDFNQQSALKAQEYSQEQALRDAEYSFNMILKESEFNHDVDLWQKEQRDSFGRVAVTLQQQYSQSRVEILTNKELTATTRQEALNQLDRNYIADLDLLAEAYGVDLDIDNLDNVINPKDPNESTTAINNSLADEYRVEPEDIDRLRAAWESNKGGMSFEDWLDDFMRPNITW